MIPIYPTASTSAFWAKMQGDDINMTEVIELVMPGGNKRYWTTSDQEITYTLSGAPTRYIPFLGKTPTGMEESMDMGVSVVPFVLANTGSDLRILMDSDDFSLASVKIGRVFVDTPDLGRVQIYEGQMGDFSHTRHDINGELRNIWKSINVAWPYYQFEDKCVWRFGSAGCGFNTVSITVAINSINVSSSSTIDLRCASGYLTRSYSNGRFDFGRATISAGTNSGHIRTVRVHTGDLLSLSHPLPNSDLTGLQISIYPGCRKTVLADCRSLYNNDKNFFGFPWIPTQEESM